LNLYLGSNVSESPKLFTTGSNDNKKSYDGKDEGVNQNSVFAISDLDPGFLSYHIDIDSYSNTLSTL